MSRPWEIVSRAIPSTAGAGSVAVTDKPDMARNRMMTAGTMRFAFIPRPMTSVEIPNSAMEPPFRICQFRPIMPQRVLWRQPEMFICFLHSGIFFIAEYGNSIYGCQTRRGKKIRKKAHRDTSQ
jgi:hypothetical protein